MTVGVDRFEGYADALRDSGQRMRKGLVEHGDFSKESGARAIKALLRRHPALDGVFVANDPMAFGALETLQALGRRVPDSRPLDRGRGLRQHGRRPAGEAARDRKQRDHRRGRGPL